MFRSSEAQVLFNAGLLQCYNCKEYKPDESFTRDKTKHSRRQRNGFCKDCRNKRYKTDLEYAAEYYQKNHLKHKEIMRAWYQLNKDKALAYWHNYKAKLKANGIYDKDITRRKLYTRDMGICQLCNLPTTVYESSIDHIKPVSKGGTHTWNNVQIAHRICNIRKGAKYECN